MEELQLGDIFIHNDRDLIITVTKIETVVYVHMLSTFSTNESRAINDVHVFIAVGAWRKIR
jgi:hypothetical protein